MKPEQIIGKEMYFVHKGTWNNEYEWRIQKITITGIKIDISNKMFVEFSFHSCGYEYPLNYLKNTLRQAKSFAIKQINKEKKKQILSIIEFKEKQKV